MKVDVGTEPFDSRMARLTSLFTTEMPAAGVTHGPFRLAQGLGNMLVMTSTCESVKWEQFNTSYSHLTISEGRMLVMMLLETNIFGRRGNFESNKNDES